MENKMKFYILLVIMFVLGGCIRYTYSLVKVTPELNPAGEGTIAIASQDIRPYIVSGERKPQMVGVIRGTFGNPISMTTASRRPLADEMGEVISGALKKNGFQPILVTVGPTESEEQVQKKLMATGAKKLIHFQIMQWKSDTWNNLRLESSLKLNVFNTGGKAMVKKELSGDENLGWVAGVNMVKHTRTKVKEAFKARMEALFNAPEVLNALK